MSYLNIFEKSTRWSYISDPSAAAKLAKGMVQSNNRVPLIFPHHAISKVYERNLDRTGFPPGIARYFASLPEIRGHIGKRDYIKIAKGLLREFFNCFSDSYYRQSPRLEKMISDFKHPSTMTYLGTPVNELDFDAWVGTALKIASEAKENKYGLTADDLKHVSESPEQAGVRGAVTGFKWSLALLLAFNLLANVRAFSRSVQTARSQGAHPGL